ncbi:hypothetical protein [Allokutzneria sp. NRRL B-24872]|uniref:hypothetical protein n=1 Tax=Allokutzneria sp. NRRL B-24872 TaxID=1137961 RepID=UPI000A394974|nr:hypothetical protein [Allokutzneria sp. NRRL B-24872]
MALIERVTVFDSPDEELLVAAMQLLALARDDVDEAERTLLAQARKIGMPWSKIAEALGLKSRQAAEQRALVLQRTRHNLALSEIGQHRNLRDPQETRRGRKRVERQRRILMENFSHLRDYAELLLQDHKASTSTSISSGGGAQRARWDDASPLVMARMSILDRTHGMGETELFKALVDISHGIAADYKHHEDFPQEIRDGIFYVLELDAHLRRMAQELS